jgi:hypothetical protein
LLHTQEVTGSSPVPPTMKLGDHLPRLKRQNQDKAGSDDLHKSKIKNLGPTAMKGET